MTLTRRTRPSGVALSSRLSELMNNRRTSTSRTRATPEPPPFEVDRAEEPQDPIEVPESDILLDILKNSRYEPRPARGGKYLHVSDLLSKCIRKFAIIEKHNMSRAGQRLSLMDSLTFGVGDSIHDTIKARAATGGATMVWGNWRCKCGTSKTAAPKLFSEIEPGLTCTACNGPINVYEEVPMKDDDLMIVGTPDLILWLPEFQAFYVTELKSIAHERWAELSRPLPEHVIQVLFYWYLMKKLGYYVANRVSILYVTKGYTFRDFPAREFHFNAEEIIGRLEPYLDEARALKAFRANGQLPARTVCLSALAPEAKKCEVCSLCFGNPDAAPKTVSIRSALRRTR